MTSEFDRRSVLGGLTAAALAATLPIAVRKAYAAPAPENLLGDGGLVRVPTNAASTGSWIKAVMDKYSLPAKYNIKVDFQPSSITSQTAVAIQSGEADIATFQFVQINLMRKKGTKIVAIMPFLEWGANQVLVPTNSPAKNIGDLKGKKLGIFNEIDIDWIVIQAIAKRDYKMDPKKDIQAQVAGIGLLMGLIQSGEIDATTIFNNLTPQLLAGGKVKVLANIRDLIADLGLPKMPFLFQVVREEYAAEHPKNVRAYAAAYREAVDLLHTDMDIWKTHGPTLSLTPEVIDRLKPVLMNDLMPKFAPTVAADVAKSFEFIKREAPEAVGGLTELDPGWITLEYQK